MSDAVLSMGCKWFMVHVYIHIKTLDAWARGKTSTINLLFLWYMNVHTYLCSYNLALNISNNVNTKFKMENHNS